MTDDLAAELALVRSVFKLSEAGLSDVEIAGVLALRTGRTPPPAPTPPVPAVTPPAAPALIPPVPLAGRPVGAPVTLDAPAGPTQTGSGRLAPAGLPGRDDLIAQDGPGEPPPGSVVTDTRSRACWREPDGVWRRADTEAALTWHDVWQSVGGPPGDVRPQPGKPTIVSIPPPRPLVPMVARPGGRLDVVVQKAQLDGDGQPMKDEGGAPRLRTVTESVEIIELVPEQRPG